MNLQNLKPLTLDQYEKCKTDALELVKRKIGSKPQRRDFVRELGATWTVLDALALIVFVAALVVSSAHIIAHMGELAVESFAGVEQDAGTQIRMDLWTNIHQWGYIALSEASMLLFMVLFAVTRSWRRWVFVAIALVAALFVVVANLSSGTGWLESLMPPIFTLGIGFHLERLIVQQLKRRAAVTDRYLSALAEWERASQDATQHAEYRPAKMNYIWQKLTSLKANAEFRDAPTRFKHAAVRREMERDEWTNRSVELLDEPLHVDESDTQPVVPVAVVDRESNSPDVIVNQAVKKCENCGARLKKPRANQKYCDASCRQEAYRKRNDVVTD